MKTPGIGLLLIGYLLLFSGTAVMANAVSNPHPPVFPQLYEAKVLGRLEQPRDHFVQGLEIRDGVLYKSLGLYGKSRLLRYQMLRSGDDRSLTLLNALPLPAQFFAEGITVLNHQLYMLTWRNRIMLAFEAASLTLAGQFKLRGEGWGLTNDGRALIYSDGSATLRFLAPNTGEVTRSITVTEAGKPLARLNELEWINGKIWANVWLESRIVIIEPDSGRVSGSIDLHDLLPQEAKDKSTNVLNGIAYDSARDEIWVTGKNWPYLYQIELVPLPK